MAVLSKSIKTINCHNQIHDFYFKLPGHRHFNQICQGTTYFKLRETTDWYNRSKTYENQSTIHYEFMIQSKKLGSASCTACQTNFFALFWWESNKMSFEKYFISRNSIMLAIIKITSVKATKKEKKTMMGKGKGEILIFFLIGIIKVSFATI